MNNKVNLLNLKNNFAEIQNKFQYLSFHDELTGLYNRNFLDIVLTELKKKNVFPVSFVLANINNLQLINKRQGRKYGDYVIKMVSNILYDFCSKNDYLIRTGGDDFLIVIFDKSVDEVEKLPAEINKRIYNNFKNNLKVSMGFGISHRLNIRQDFNNLITTAGNNMYLNKLNNEDSLKHQIINSLVNTLVAKSYESSTHADRMKTLAVQLGVGTNLSKRELDELELLADLHDIGKVAVPEKILKKPGQLSPEEFEVIKTHPEIGYNIVKDIAELQNVAKGILSHHERWDGGGYPYGLREEKIPIIARIITIIDSFDVMMNERPYKKAYSLSYTIKELEKCAGSQFDPRLVNIFLKDVINNSYK